MRVSLDWLAEFIALPPEHELTKRLELSGFEDVIVERLGPDLSAIRVGRVLERLPHPNADRLSVCRVELGEGEPIEIVCGAPNVVAEQKVAVASPGGVLPDGTELKRTKIRGVVSHGMICSSRELGLGDEHDGILVLDPDAPVGASLPHRTQPTSSGWPPSNAQMPPPTPSLWLPANVQFKIVGVSPPPLTNSAPPTAMNSSEVAVFWMKRQFTNVVDDGDPKELIAAPPPAMAVLSRKTQS